MTTIPQPVTIDQAARLRRCPICDTPPSAPCQAKPAAEITRQAETVNYRLTDHQRLGGLPHP